MNQEIYDRGFTDGYAEGKRDAMKWISVKERLPETYVKVLIHLDFGQYTEVWCGRYRGSNGFRPIWEIVGGLEVGENVTHWMPLPPPPEGGQDD